MSNRFYLGSLHPLDAKYLSKFSRESILEELISCFKKAQESRKYFLLPSFSPSLPIDIETEIRTIEEEKTNWFGKKKIVKRETCDFILCFEKEMTEQDLIFWRGFICGKIFWKRY